MHGQPHEDLALIRRIMEETRREVIDRGRHFMLWGVLNAAGLIATDLFIRGMGLPDPRWVWVGLLVVGWAGSMVIGMREGSGARVRTAGRRLLGVTWMAVAASITLIAAAGMFGSVVEVSSLAGLLSAVLAAPVLVTAVLTGERWLVVVAAGWWIGGGVMLFVPGGYALLLMAAMSLLLLAVPGAVLHARSRGREDMAGRAAAERPAETA